MKLPLLFFMILFVAGASAQKLPAVQTGSLRAPAHVRIDGNATDWGDKWQAYNKTTQIYYNIANDDDNLYLIVQAKSEVAAQKLVRGGLTFTVSNSGSKSDKHNPSVTFPVYDKMDTPKVMQLIHMPESSADNGKNKTYLDSISKVRNLKLNDWLKTIGLSALTGITEPEISLYNEEGIKAALRFDSNLYCTYELAIPLKYLRISLAGKTKFNYQIKLNGAAVNGTDIKDLRDGKIFTWTGADGKSYNSMSITDGLNSNAGDLVFPTDFWGQYQLIRK